MPLNVRVPKLSCKTFSGKGKDKLEFKNFWTQFQNCIDACGDLSGANKLTYLRSYLDGYALQLISHLTINDDNYKVAQELLKEEYLDEEFIIDESFKSLLSSSPSQDSSFEGLRAYVNECRAITHDLQQYGIDFLAEKSAGSKLLSHIVFSKLPPAVKRELVTIAGNNYPALKTLFTSYRDIIKKLVRVGPPEPTGKGQESGARSKDAAQGHAKPLSRPPQQQSRPGHVPPSTPSTLENFSTAVPRKEPNNRTQRALLSKPQERRCKLCTGGHAMSRCGRYPTQAVREARCRELNLCLLCTSSHHAAEQCPGKSGQLQFECFLCHSRSHCTTMCSKPQRVNLLTNLCINVHQGNSWGEQELLPVLSLTFYGVGNRSRRVRCLLDSGSQRSYLSKDIVDYLLGGRSVPTIKYGINTFLGSGERELGESLLEVSVPGGSRDYVNMFACPDFNVHHKVLQLDSAVANLVKEGYRLAEPSLAKDGERVPIFGLAGGDIIQRFPQYALTKCMSGAAMATSIGLIPFGDVANFLYPGQVAPVNLKPYAEMEAVADVPLGLHEIDADPPAALESLQTAVNSVLSPRKTYFSPLETLFPDSSVEQGLEAMFSLDSLGHNEETESDCDQQLIQRFENGISLHDGKYHVSIPWKEDVVDLVPSNHKVALAVLDRVNKDLDKKGLWTSYQEVFSQQLNDDIIEEINVSPSDYHKFIWIPHRPVVKTEANTTTKIRPVFNCSLKTHNAPSLNEAAFTGVNLMKDIVQLSLYFRSNKYAMLSDIKSAFLQIRLAREVDKNRFCFFHASWR